MTKEEFTTRRTEIIYRMLDNPDENGVFATTKCFQELDDLFDEIKDQNNLYKCQGCGVPIRVVRHYIERSCNECTQKAAT